VTQQNHFSFFQVKCRGGKARKIVKIIQNGSNFPQHHPHKVPKFIDFCVVLKPFEGKRRVSGFPNEFSRSFQDFSNKFYGTSSTHQGNNGHPKCYFSHSDTVATGASV
jgi:hypothetical protein